MKGNIYHGRFEVAVDAIKYRVEEVEREENENKDNHLTYQTLLKFFYDTRQILQEE